MEKIVEIALPVSSVRNFAYRCGLSETSLIGKRAEVPFGKRTLTGVITKEISLENFRREKDFDLKAVASIIDKEPVFPPDLFELSLYISAKYFVSQGEAFSAMLSRTARPAKREKKEKEILIEPSAPLSPTPDQLHIIEKISEKIKAGIFSENLIFGVSDSGKTEIYLRLIEETLAQNRSVIYVVPEIALIPQAQMLIKKRFGPACVHVLHHKLTPIAKYSAWQSIQKGGPAIVLGARSAIFAPVPDLGCVIIDEEHSESYFQDNAPTYNTRDIARYRCSLSKAALVQGSATPLVETVFHTKNSERGEVFYLREKISQSSNDVSIVDLKNELPGSGFISVDLRKKIASCLSKNEQVILFINRRGFYRFLHCPKCGLSVKCPDCSVSGVYHSVENKLKCHLCGRSFDVPQVCPECGGQKLRFQGYGTERIETEIKNIFPTARVLRMDRDVSSRAGFYDEFYEDFKNRKIDIAIGTQILVKGFDFHSVTLTAVIFLDGMFNIPDYNSAARSLSLIIQAAGRSGRGETASKTVIQTFNPANQYLGYLEPGGYFRFVEKELEERKKLSYPPYSDFVRLVFSDFIKERARGLAERFYSALSDEKNENSIRIYPVCQPFYEKIAKKFRYHIVLRGEIDNIISFLAPHRDFLMQNRSRGVHIEVTPANLL